MINDIYAYIDEVSFWQYDKRIGEYAKVRSERAMPLSTFLKYVDCQTSQCKVKWMVDSMNPDYITDCVYVGE